MADEYPLAGRGVYAEDFTIKGRRGFYAVDSAGEQIAYRTVAKGKDPAPTIADLWAELNELDPISAHDEPPSLRLVP